MEQFAPIALFVYNRPDHTRKMISALNRAKGSDKSQLFIFSDAAKTDKAEKQVNAVREIIDAFSESSSFERVNVIKAKENKGLAKSIIEGVNQIIEQYGQIIVLEDDLEVSNDFIVYMNEALEYYKNNNRIWSISGYSFPMKSTRNISKEVFFSGRACCWGWATWLNRWKTVDWNVDSYPDFKFNFGMRRQFGRWGKDLPTMLDAYMYHEIQSWAIRWCYAAFKQGQLCVYPVNSRIVNIGTDGSGTNYNSACSLFDTTLYEGDEKCTFIDVYYDEAIRKEFSRKYLNGLELVKRQIRWLLIRTGMKKAVTRR